MIRTVICYALMCAIIPVMAQRVAKEKFVIPAVYHNDKSPTDTLWPGNSLSATEFVLLADSNGGYVLGTDSYHDVCKGQQFHVDTGYIIEGAIYWLGAKEIVGDTGSLKFTVWRMDGLQGYTMAGGNQPSPGTEHTSVTYSLSTVDTTSSLSSAFAVIFPSPITVLGDYVIGFDMTGMGNDTIGMMSTTNGAGGGNELVWEKWGINSSWHTLQASGWGFPALLDIDAMILPVIDMSSAGISEAPFIKGIRCKAYPNPVSDKFRIEIDLKSSSANNSIEILAANGQRFLKMNPGTMDIGQNNINFDACLWPSGNYFCIVQTDQSRYAIRISVSR